MGYDWTSFPRCGEPIKDPVDACAHRLLSLGVENEEWATLESATAQVGVDFQGVLPGSVHAGLRR
jgi:hypothetical protein